MFLSRATYTFVFLEKILRNYRSYLIRDQPEQIKQLAIETRTFPRNPVQNSREYE